MTGKDGQARTHRGGRGACKGQGAAITRPAGDIVTAGFSTSPLAVILEGSNRAFAEWLATRVANGRVTENAPNSRWVWVPVPLDLRLFRRSTRSKQMVFEFHTRAAATRFVTDLDHFVKLGEEPDTYHNVYVGRVE